MEALVRRLALLRGSRLGVGTNPWCHLELVEFSRVRALREVRSSSVILACDTMSRVSHGMHIYGGGGGGRRERPRERCARVRAREKFYSQSRSD